MGKLRLWANHASRAAKDGHPLDVAAEARRWAEQARASEAGALEPLLPAVSARQGAGSPAPAPIQELSLEQEREVMALARVQESQPTWRKADLIRHLGELLPDHVACADDGVAAALLTRLAGTVLAGGASQQVLALEAPEWPPVPESLRRADGRSTAEQAQGATGSGLRLDQAAAAFLALTGGRRAEILVGPAGSGTLYRRAGSVVVMLAVAPEAAIDRRGSGRALAVAEKRLSELEE